MPATTNPIEIHVGRGDIWIGVTAPVTPPVPLVGGIPTTGRFIGSTLEAASFIYRPTTFDIRTQQDTGVVGYVITEEDVRLEFQIGELSYQNLRDLLIGALDQGSFISLGSIIIPPTISVLLTAPKRSGGSAFIEAMIYNAVFSEDRAFPFARQSWTNVRIVGRAQVVPGRQQGDRLGFIHPNVISS